MAPRINYKSVRLLVEAIHKEMDNLRKSVMSCEISPEKSVDVYEAMGSLRGMFDELGVFATRPTIDEVLNQPPVDYVATMKPLVRRYHQQLMSFDKLAPALCEDLNARGCMLILIGEGNTLVRAAHNPEHPEVELAMEMMLAAIDNGTRQTLEEGTAEAEKQLGLQPIEQEDSGPLRVKYHDAIQQDDLDRNRKAEFVVDMNDVVVKDRKGPAGRVATREEIDGCISVKDAGDEDSNDDERTRLLKAAVRVGWDTEDGMRLREQAKRFSEGEELT